MHTGCHPVLESSPGKGPVLNSKNFLRSLHNFDLQATAQEQLAISSPTSLMSSRQMLASATFACLLHSQQGKEGASR